MLIMFLDVKSILAAKWQNKIVMIIEFAPKTALCAYSWMLHLIFFPNS